MRKLGLLLVLSAFVVAVGPEPVHGASDLEMWCQAYGAAWDGGANTCTVSAFIVVGWAEVTILPVETLVNCGTIEVLDMDGLLNSGTIYNYGMFFVHDLWGVQNYGTIYNLCTGIWGVFYPDNHVDGVFYDLENCGFLPMVVRN